MNPQTGSRVDLTGTAAVVAAAAARRREPIPIVDPKSGSKVDALRPAGSKARGPVAIINPMSGEQVLKETEERLVCTCCFYGCLPPLLMAGFNPAVLHFRISLDFPHFFIFTTK